MPAPPCAICGKTVYPMEALNALDKTFHKGCFKCKTCSVTLNLKNFKSFQGEVYCAVHMPTAKPTQVGDVTMKTAQAAPKQRRAQGFDKTQRMTFAPGQLNPLTTPGKAPSYSPTGQGGAAGGRRVQGVNKMERMTFAPGAIKPTGGSAPRGSSATPSYEQETSYDEPASTESYSYDEPEGESISYEESPQEGGYEESAYEEPSYDEPNYGEDDIQPLGDEDDSIPAPRRPTYDEDEEPAEDNWE
eukprot:TRINITY_DN15458_c0_g1_i1.p1 TRINITY_DN15458_c0_g1~~TRINITY_DN15458_c0_g1_i1.p1  ORF type:complete len:245 (+),score=49.19 TRINITY_DN15458_c0_g1_i1:91-825(+)